MYKNTLESVAHSRRTELNKLERNCSQNFNILGQNYNINFWVTPMSKHSKSTGFIGFRGWKFRFWGPFFDTIDQFRDKKFRFTKSVTILWKVNGLKWNLYMLGHGVGLLEKTWFGQSEMSSLALALRQSLYGKTGPLRLKQKSAWGLVDNRVKSSA